MILHSIHRSLVASKRLTKLTLPPMPIQSTSSTRRLSSWNSSNPNAYDSEEEERPQSRNIQVNIAEIGSGGSHITLNHIDSIKSTYHASWLWSNDPKRVLLPSGQRSCTPGQWRSVYGKPTIKDATIIYCDVESEGEMTDSSTDAAKVLVPGPTPKHCCHPLSTYGAHPSWISAASFPDNTNNINLRPYLQINWSKKTNDGETDTSLFDVEWLERFRYDDNARINRRKRTEVQPIHAIRRSGPPLCYSLESERSKHESDGLVHVDYQSIIGTDGKILEKGLLSLLNAIFRDGAAIVSGTSPPTEMESTDENKFPVANIAKAMSGGSLSHGALYGNIFHVRQGEANSTNVAYTSHPLGPHQDLAYYESPPGIQLLHCVSMGKGVVGGESTLVDALAAAYRLRELRPESFAYLVKCPATFVKQRDGACMTYRRPHIVLAEEGYNGNKFDREIVAVNWSPPFEGPVQLPHNDVDRYYEAYADFEQMVDNSHGINTCNELSEYSNEYTWERKLEPGEILVFNNRRMLHGRRGFSIQQGQPPEESQRHLVGCYINLDDTLSQYRVLLHKSDATLGSPILNVCNGSNIIP